MIELSLTLFLISWFVLGLICVMIICVSDMRGQEFDEDYFNAPMVTMFIILIVLGYVSVFITYYLFLTLLFLSNLYSSLIYFINVACILYPSLVNAKKAATPVPSQK